MTAQEIQNALVAASSKLAAAPQDAAKVLRLDLIPCIQALLETVAQNTMDITRTYALAERTASYDVIEAAAQILGEALETYTRDPAAAMETFRAAHEELTSFLAIDEEEDE